VITAWDVSIERPAWELARASLTEPIRRGPGIGRSRVSRRCAMFDELMLPEQAELRQDARGGSLVALPLRLPWYRSLPISCLDGIDISVDGVAVPEAAVTISVGDAEHAIVDTGDLSEVEWFVLDQAVARFPVPQTVAPGFHDVAVTLTVRIPYAEPEYWPIDFTQTAKHTRSVELLGTDS